MSSSRAHVVLAADAATKLSIEVRLEKPLGLVLEEAEAGSDAGVEVSSMVEGASAEKSGQVQIGDALLKVGPLDVASLAFDEVMEALLAAPATVDLTLARAVYEDDALPLDITPNLAKSLSAEDAVKVDKAVRAARDAVRASPAAGRELGRLISIEIIIGAGVQKDATVAVRFFGIFSTSGVGGGSSYSCNVSATAVFDEDDVRITKLSWCASDSDRRASPHRPPLTGSEALNVSQRQGRGLGPHDRLDLRFESCLVVLLGKILVKTRDPAPTQADLLGRRTPSRRPAGTPGGVPS